jgi:hypothetical protein
LVTLKLYQKSKGDYKMINYVEEPETNSSAMRHGEFSDAVRQVLENVKLRIEEAKVRAREINPTG